MKTNAARRWFAQLAAVPVCLLFLPWSALGGEALGPLEEGRQLFEKQFEAGRSPGSRGDGLGPVFNNVSCVACHVQGGAGGAGPLDVNVQVLAAQLSGAGRRPQPKELVDRLTALHPGFVSGEQIIPTLILHRFGTAEQYAALHRSLGGLEVPREPTPTERDELQRELAKLPVATAKVEHPLKLLRVQRNSTALFGAGLIDQVPDAVLHALAASQKKEAEVSGRVPPVGTDKVGRFGWRGQTPRLHDFVLGACANELGLEVPDNPQPLDPLQPKYRPAGLDLTAAQCASLTAYVGSLPQPRFVEPEVPEQREIVARGRSIFASVGCAACHAERIGPLEGVFSDLLLHDMGPALADPVPAEATLVFLKEEKLTASDLLLSDDGQVSSQPRPIPQPQPPRPRGYNGGSGSASLSLVANPSPTFSIIDSKAGVRREFRIVDSNVESEWRTPPLWGLADSAPYLHDGRAATVIEAIALHGGEADACTKRYFALPAGDRLAMLEFLSCLRAPR